jgi:ribose 5-phosphate isomerase B
MRIALGSDHRGFQAKEKIKAYLTQLNHEVLDVGVPSADSADYPDTAFPCAQAVVKGEADMGILICGTGIGMSIAANKVPGVRAALCHDELTAEMARQHNDANVLCLAADLIGEQLARRVVDAWLKSDFAGGRHERRVKKIAKFEQDSSGEAKP